ncbi:hypothetical protein [Roseibium album]|uniref:hypothetical protein n=1 Tax=Roseibium album TaxID=311410 RepID=UPI002490FC2A|nr:hypothetical protein [Roseibium album]
MAGEHAANYALPFQDITSLDPQQVAQVCDDMLNELDAARCSGMTEPLEFRINRLELALLTLATAIKNRDS